VIIELIQKGTITATEYTKLKSANNNFNLIDPALYTHTVEQFMIVTK
jgi:hypothetical protein